MNLPTLIGALIVAAILAAILVRGIINKRNHKGGCSSGGHCPDCPSKGLCHPES